MVGGEKDEKGVFRLGRSGGAGLVITPITIKWEVGSIQDGMVLLLDFEA